MDSGAVMEGSVQAAICAVCYRVLSADNQMPADIDICMECKFLYIEGLESPARGSPSRTRNTSRRRMRRRQRRSRYNTSASVDRFTQHVINFYRQNQAAYEHYESAVWTEIPESLWQQSISRSTPSESRRWHQVSDTESDGLDNTDSLYGESESNASFGRYRAFHGESDGISISTNGGDSDASVYDQSLLDTDLFGRPGDSDINSDTDIDPMQAGVTHWDLDDLEGNGEMEEDGEGVWGDGDGDGDGVFPEYEGVVHWRVQQMTRGNASNAIDNLDVLEPYDGGDYLDARNMDEMLAYFAEYPENDMSMRGPPPASVSFVNSLPLYIIKDEHVKNQDSTCCAICKDALTVGTVVNQLPCLHIYHPSCILPWLRSRNSCPLCRFELPTDNKDYEDNKRNSKVTLVHRSFNNGGLQRVTEERLSGLVEANEAVEVGVRDGVIENRDLQDGNSSSERLSEEGGGPGRWFFYAAATPIFSLVGIVLVLWLGHPIISRRGNHHLVTTLEGGGPRQLDVLSDSPIRSVERSRRWWSLF